MSLALNATLFHRALAHAKDGNVDHGEWSAPVGHEQDAENCLAHDADAAGTEEEWKYPIFSDGKLSAKGVGSALAYAEKNNEHALIAPLKQISEAIASRKPNIAAHAPAIYILQLAADGEGKPVPMGLEGLPTVDDAGQPIHYRKTLIATCRNWVHRGTGESLPITTDRADEWVRNTTALAAAGVYPFIPTVHNFGACDARDNLGNVVRVTREGNNVYAIVALHGDEALKVAARNGRSVGITRDARDASGRVYHGESLHHLALVPNPALPDLGGMVQIAASADGANAINVPVYHAGPIEPAQSNPTNPATPENTMPTTPTNAAPKLALDAADGDPSPAEWSAMSDLPDGDCSPQVQAAMHKAGSNTARVRTTHGEHRFTIGVHGDAKGVAQKTAQAIHDAKANGTHVAAEHAKTKSTISLSAGAGGTNPPTTAASRRSYRMTPELAASVRQQLGFGSDVADDQLDNKTAEKAIALCADVQRLTQERDAKVQEVLSLSGNDPTKLDPMSVSLITRAFKTDRERVIESGVVSEAGMSAIDALCFDNGKPTRIALSLSAGSVDPFYSRLCEILRKNPGIRIDGQTASGTVAKPVAALSGDGKKEPQGNPLLDTAKAMRGMK